VTQIQLRGNRAAIDECYRDVYKYIRMTVRKLARIHRLDPAEALAEANLIFLKAYHTYDPSRGPLYKRVRSMIWYGLMGEMRRRAKQWHRHPTVPLGSDIAKPEPRRAEVCPDLYARASADVRTLLSLLVEPPPELREFVTTDAPTRQDVRRKVAEYLIGLGWDADRVRVAFKQAATL
jgi:DNA-directed RNA polymerase specialized sigma24 family protein